MRTAASSTTVLMTTSPPASVNFIAFDSRLSSTCRIFFAVAAHDRVGGHVADLEPDALRRHLMTDGVDDVDQEWRERRPAPSRA